MTDRERVLRWIHKKGRGRWLTAQQVGEALGFAPTTAGAHLKYWHEKFGPAFILRRRIEPNGSHGVMFAYRFQGDRLPEIPRMPDRKGRPGADGLREGARRLAEALARWPVPDRGKPSRNAQGAPDPFLGIDAQGSPEGAADDGLGSPI